MKIKLIVPALILLITGTAKAQKVDSNGMRMLKEVQQYTSSTNDDARKFYELGYRNVEKGDLKNGIKYYKKAIGLDSGFVDAYDNCGIAYRHLDMLDSAVWCYTRSIKKYPKGKLSHMNLAVAYSLQKKYDEALSEYDILQTIDPNDPESYYGKAHIYLLANNPDKALPEAEKSLKLYQKYSPDLVGDAEAQIGLCYYFKGDKKNAKKYITKAKQDKGIVPQRVADDLGVK
jgi:tetratricopeptide (TPR) repeat protein